ncbi:MAG: NUDIX hydrolase [Algoriphagus sp.]|uniref:NUDIX hydrolase n=1 Tax=Algoriphagus sp. TaxID=1872435 RepID=UPI002727E4D3|nr:NUDIX hydrolase [Algoriphagus sp.]MDO8965964.1 NUDIX hydrolase [Algoriphagus sp.]MDP2041487.1 NUDIX hydrolase [Algoriphagus sp.]MDP3198490.1 NUDIX hydrolase [Algoriphagus sp.]MDP3472518.1 NUDIX hydrolase [Algoriphagus sp.]
MDRIALRKQLEFYRTPFEEESAFIADFTLLTHDPLGYKREQLDGHFTASAWIVNKSRTHTLLTLHRKLGRWLQLGGHADGNENLIEVALKEAEEESGLTSLELVDSTIFDLDKHIIPERPHVKEHFHFDVRYLFEADINEPLVISDESVSLAWITFDSVVDMIGYNPSILRMLEKTSKSEILL